MIWKNLKENWLAIITAVITTTVAILGNIFNWTHKDEIYFTVNTFILGMIIFFLGSVYILHGKMSDNLQEWTRSISQENNKLNVRMENLSENLQGVQEGISRSIAKEVIAEHTLHKIILKNVDYKEYFSHLVSIHNMFADVNKDFNKPILSNSLDLIKNSTLYIKGFFENDKYGGIYKVTDAVNLYRSLIGESRSLMIFEPKIEVNYKNNWDDRYIDFLEHQREDDKEFQKTFIFLEERDIKNSPSGFLQKNKFNVRFLRKPTFVNDKQSQKYLEYSHVVFKMTDHYISCSVLPTFKDINPDNQTNFTGSELVYFAFRVFSIKNKDADDNLITVIRILINKAEKGIVPPSLQPV